MEWKKVEKGKTHSILEESFEGLVLMLLTFGYPKEGLCPQTLDHSVYDLPVFL